MSNILWGRLEQVGLLAGQNHFALMQLEPGQREAWFSERRGALREWMHAELARRFGDSEWWPADRVRPVIDRDPLTLGISSRATPERRSEIDPLTGTLSGGGEMLFREVRGDQVRAWVNSAEGTP